MDNQTRPEQKNEAPMPHVEATLKEEQLPTQRYKPLYRSTQIVWYILGVIETFLLLRLFLRAFGANPQAGFTQFIYVVTAIFAGPFYYVFNVTQVEGNAFEWSTLLAMAVYLLFAWLIVKAIVMARPVSTKEASQKLPEQEKL